MLHFLFLKGKVITNIRKFRYTFSCHYELSTGGFRRIVFYIFGIRLIVFIVLLRNKFTIYCIIVQKDGFCLVHGLVKALVMRVTMWLPFFYWFFFLFLFLFLSLNALCQYCLHYSFETLCDLLCPKQFCLHDVYSFLSCLKFLAY